LTPAPKIHWPAVEVAAPASSLAGKSGVPPRVCLVRAPGRVRYKNPAVAVAARALRQVRHEIIRDKGRSLRELHKSLETPGENRLS